MSDKVDNVMNSVQDQDSDDDTGVYVDDSPSSSAEEPAAEPAAEPEETEDPVSTQEVVQNVQEILSSTETNVTVDNSELENRVKVLEEKLMVSDQKLLLIYNRLIQKGVLIV